eukprot:4848864-Alexandrium_andersonii.AAC.1
MSSQWVKAAGGQFPRWGVVRMSDPEGDRGTYRGPLDEQDRAEGEGCLRYDKDRLLFVGLFSAGVMREGVLYDWLEHPWGIMKD